MDSEKLRIEYFQNDIPVPYQLRCGLELFIYPIKVKDWYKVDDFSLLNINKNEINDKNIIMMSYLQFLNEVYFVQFEEEKQRFLNIMCLCLGYDKDEIQFGYKDKKPHLVFLDKDNNILGYMASKEFDDICKIILFQNIIGYDGEYVSQDVRNEIQRYLTYHSNKDTKSPTLEEKKVYVFAKRNMSMLEINEMSYRLFTQTYDVLFECEQFLADKMIQASEKYKVEKNIYHPLIAIKETIYDRVFGSFDEIKNKITQANN